MRSVFYVSMRVCAMLMLAMSLTACSTTPDRYAFWRDNAPAADANSTAAKPNLADIPTSPNVDQARQDMKDLQTKLAADRDEATAQAQTDKDVAAGKISQPLAAIHSGAALKSDTIPPVGTGTASAITSSNTLADNTGVPANTSAQPAMTNPNRNVDGNPTWPVYMPPSVQINPVVPNNVPLHPYAALQPAPDYAYGRSAVQSRQPTNDVAQSAPGTLPAMLNNDNVTVDLSALGLAKSGSAYSGKDANSIRAAGINGVLSTPAIYFKHGSTRLSPNDRKKLANLAASAAATRQPVRLIGHASTRTAAKSAQQAKTINMHISAKRATNVLNELTKKGVPPNQIQTTAVGDKGAQTAPSEAAARRVDVLIGH